jgi:hypothetical protein
MSKSKNICDIDTLLKQRDELNKQYHFYLNIANNLKKDIDTINNKIELICNHDWQKICEYGGGRTEYSCSICNAYQC